ncbi:ornithine cyclodeaminase [Pseudorhizobium tarimense]|uniref:Ornithine cyclodeaminase n=1 Tax=Pseudorhizobium tarimense TaxID=1079109 RepID=A0ABV2H8F9_9HYPH|nr:ornithine cyclodeaminase family protein [Pseudorhizobium tarimense]MCJ8519770.1 ornithine cyclodeaminase family protein [Pseudorhizobium tarimense]
MLVLDENQTRAALPWEPLIAAIETMFTAECVTPVRHHHEVEVPGEAAATMLLMPAWVPGEHMGVKILNLFPDNHRRALPTIIGRYLLSSARTGEMLAMVEGGELTARRTAATSALASRYLSRPGAEHMLMVGAGRLALNLMQAHACVRPLKRFTVWARNADKAQACAAEARAARLSAVATADLAAAAGDADIISCATLSSEPLIRGTRLKPGTHLDLVGAFKPDTRESDDACIERSSVFVDTRAGALKEGGDIVQPIRIGLLKEAGVLAELAELVSGQPAGRANESEITLFKSVGAALEDLAGAVLACRQSKAGATG